MAEVSVAYHAEKSPQAAQKPRSVHARQYASLGVRPIRRVVHIAAYKYTLPKAAKDRFATDLPPRVTKKGFF